MKAIIYKITNLVNGKIYVGKTTKTAEERLKKHFTSTHNLALKRSFAKHGKENFKIEVLEECELANINEREIFYISLFDSTNPYIGYNFTAGGEGGKDCITIMAPEKRKKYFKKKSASHKKMWRRPGFREKMIAMQHRPEVVKAKSEAAKRTSARPEIKLKRSLAKIGKAVPLSARKRISYHLRGENSRRMNDNYLEFLAQSPEGFTCEDLASYFSVSKLIAQHFIKRHLLPSEKILLIGYKNRLEMLKYKP